MRELSLILATLLSVSQISEAKSIFNGLQSRENISDNNQSEHLNLFPALLSFEDGKCMIDTAFGLYNVLKSICNEIEECINTNSDDIYELSTQSYVTVEPDFTESNTILFQYITGNFSKCLKNSFSDEKYPVKHLLECLVNSIENTMVESFENPFGLLRNLLQGRELPFQCIERSFFINRQEINDVYKSFHTCH
ncbi:uncharacterized protein LOC143912314 [Arctopsyche grandis]|uniref:uncharacterized protein LOC143912314 n=1 Tax=Arctopsyche grandis TaxID=121162 RepID=UPI00406D6614